MQQQRADATRGSLAAVLLGFFVVMLDTTIVNVALPDVGRSLGAGVAGLQWLVDAYTLTFAGLLLSGGAACDIIGARRVYVVGLTIFGALSVACALAPTIEVLIAARALQGAGAAAVVPGSLALLAAHYPEPRRRARDIG
jgi:DHA2 family methylenomycin A resistance protein-like MFS transporter